MDPDLTEMVDPQKLLNGQAAPGSQAQKNWHSVLGERELAAIKLAASYADLGQPGVPGHIYLVLIHKLALILDTLDPAFELELEAESG